MFAKIDSGRRGEAIAVSYLKKRGYRIIERNYRTKLGEIDIIADCKGCICFIEVRARDNRVYGLPEETILKKKQLKVSKTALAYIKRFGLEDRNCRFDVVCVDRVGGVDPEARLIKDAFELDARYSY